MSKKQKKQKPRNQTNRRPVPSHCVLCKDKVIVDYKKYQVLEKFLTDRKKILGRSRTGVCSKHQKKLTQAIKRARHLALLPFVASLK